MWIIILIVVIVLIVISHGSKSNNNTKDTHMGSPNIQKNSNNITPVKIESPEMVEIIGGSFTMGSNPNQDKENDNFTIYQRSLNAEKPQHLVSVNNFKISTTMIRNEQYALFLNARKIGSDGLYQGNKLIEMDDTYQQLKYIDDCWIVERNIYGQSIYEGYPIQMITWFGANEYCKWAGGRLPTEAEWEYAARGGIKGYGYRYSGSNVIDDVARFTNYPYTYKVATKKPNELGLYDMSGNACEWCSDWYGDYQSEAQKNPTGPISGSTRVVRGGDGRCEAISCRVTSRGYALPDRGKIACSFRLVIPYDETN